MAADTTTRKRRSDERVNASPVDVLWTEADLAKRWNKSVKTIQAQRQRGDGPQYIKIGNSVRYRPTVVEEYEDKNTCAHTAQCEVPS